MQIGQFISSFFSKNEKIEVYGAGRAAYHLCNKLAQRGHTVQVFVPFKRDLVEDYGNMIVHFYRSFLKFGITNISYKLLFEPMNYDVDIVHVHNDTIISVIAGLRYAKKKNKPLLVTWHGDWIENYGGVIRRIATNFSNKYLVSRLLSHADVIFTPSEYYINESSVLERYKDKIVVIPNGINIEDFDIPYSKEECREKLRLPVADNVILFVGALYPLKGPDILLKAMPKIIKEIPDTKLVFVGDGVSTDELKELSKKLNVDKHIKFAGFLEDTFKKAMYYKAADIFVLPSFTEAFPIVLLEASASGLPMVVSDLNTLKCIIKDGYNGLFTRRGDENNLADAIINLLENEAVRERMGNNARKKVEDYSWKKIAEETEKIYEAVLQ